MKQLNLFAKRECANCGNDISNKLPRIKHCSHKCSVDAKRMADAECKLCGCQFRRYRSNLMYCSVDCRIRAKRSKLQRLTVAGGYIRLFWWEGDVRKSELEHRLVMSRAMSRPLRDSETVHHKNGVRSDNRLENLELWTGNHSTGAKVLDVVLDVVRFGVTEPPEGQVVLWIQDNNDQRCTIKRHVDGADYRFGPGVVKDKAGCIWANDWKGRWRLVSLIACGEAYQKASSIMHGHTL
jgi:hypothetical protein